MTVVSTSHMSVKSQLKITGNFLHCGGLKCFELTSEYWLGTRRLVSSRHKCREFLLFHFEEDLVASNGAHTVRGILWYPKQ